MTSPEFSIRTGTADDYELVGTTFTRAMLFEFTASEVGRNKFEPERALIAEAEGEPVGVAMAMTRDLSVPGAVVPAAHVSAVGVTQTFRRRGVLSGLMRRQLREVPEALAVLWASEPGIYGRFGYAPAAYRLWYTARLSRLGAVPVTDTGRLRDLAVAGAGEVLAPVLSRYQRQRPGVSGRGPAEWAVTLDDPADRRHGKSALRIVVHEDASGQVDGYLMWRTKMDFDTAGPNGELSVSELVATTTEAYRSLWNHALTMDLCQKLEFGNAAVDEPIYWMVSDPRALDARWADSLWVRITDARRALELRRYAAPVDVVLDISDELIDANAGRFRLTGDAEKARCEPTGEPADISLSIADLGGVYLGGRSLAELAVTGGVTEHKPGAVAAASAGFGWPVAPASIEIF